MVSKKEMLDYISTLNPGAVYPTGCEEAVIGYVERFGMEPLVLLDRTKCIEILTSGDEMSGEEAEEFFEYNIMGAWVGEGTPCYATLEKDFVE